MKKLIHPKLSQTIIQLKDGAAYYKCWLFFKPVLSLEIDYLGNAYWKRIQNKKKIK